MRLLSFFNLVEHRLVAARPTLADDWQRRVNYGSFTASLSHPCLDFTLTVRGAADGNFNAIWRDAAGLALPENVFHSRALGFDWEHAAGKVAAQLPA